jgi:hypothetical protein
MRPNPIHPSDDIQTMNANAAPVAPTRQLNPRLIPNPPRLWATANRLKQRQQKGSAETLED